MPASTPLLDRFWIKVDKDGPIPIRHPEIGPCWIWTGSLNAHCYDTFNTGSQAAIHDLPIGKTWLAHRVSYYLENGTIEPELDHQCDNPSCVRPSHLRSLTHKENMLRGQTNMAAVNSAKTYCDHGHLLEGDNVYWRLRTGNRACKECVRVRRGYPGRIRNIMTDEQVAEIELLATTTTLMQREIGALYGITQSAVSNILNGHRRPLKVTV